MRTLSSFTSKLITNPCKLLLNLLTLPFTRKPISIRAFRSRKPRKSRPRRRRKTRRLRALLSLFRRRPSSEIGELKSMVSERGQGPAGPLSSPLTPACIKMVAAGGERRAESGGDVEEACRSFENYLVEMIVEEGKVRDLADVEELLYCWSRLKSPVFVDLVCSFYGELCKDLFAGSDQDCDDDQLADHYDV